MGIKDWLRRHRVDPEGERIGETFDRIVENQREQAQIAVHQARQQLQDVRRLRPESGNVHSKWQKMREDNHFSQVLFRALKEGPQ